MDRTELIEGVLRSGDVVRFFHEHEGKFLTLDVFGGKPCVFLRATGRETAATATSSKGLWVVEIVNEEPCVGQAGRWSSRFRFRHSATGQFLAVEVTGEENASSEQQKDGTDPPYWLLTSESRNANTVFEFDPFQISPKDALVPQASSVWIRNVLTSSWIHSTAIPVGRNGVKPAMTRIGCSPAKEEKETFSIIPAPASEVRDLEFVLGATKLLSKLGDAIRSGESGREELATATQLLSQVTEFIRSEETASEESTAQTPERDRQKLLREQGTLEHIFDLLRALFERARLGDVVLDEKDPERAVHERVRRFGCEILRLSQQGYRKNREYIADQCSLLKNKTGYVEQAENFTGSNRPLHWKILDEVFSNIGC